MSITVHPELMDNIEKFGAFDIKACFNCGNCTAVCPNSDDKASFPRKIIRYGQLGMKEQILSSPDLWLCYYCGECSKTCPRQAEPGEYLASLRRYAISCYEPTGIARLFHTNNLFATALTIVLASILGFLLLTIKSMHWGQEYHITRYLFSRIDYHFIEYLGIAIFVLVTISTAGCLVNLLKRLLPVKMELKQAKKAALRVMQEIFTMKRYHDCERDSKTPWLLQRWVLHLTTMWGFVGLLIATTLDIPWLGLKDPNSSSFLPSRIIGIASGLLLMYGATFILWFRIAKTDKNTEHSRFSDWFFVIALWMLGFTGFWLTGSVYFFAPSPLHEAVLLIHTVMAMELLLLFAFSKFTHVIYRPLALFSYYLKQDSCQ